jgi:GTP cyclohydrolase I
MNTRLYSAINSEAKHFRVTSELNSDHALILILQEIKPMQILFEHHLTTFTGSPLWN